MNAAAMMTSTEPRQVKETRYVVTFEPFYRFLPNEIVEVRNNAKILRLPPWAFRALMHFTESRTVDEVLLRDRDLSRDDLLALVAELESHELLSAVDGASRIGPVDVETSFTGLFRTGVFDDAASVEAMAGALADGRAIVIPDALCPGLADRIHAELSGDLRWQNVEEFDQISHFRFRSLDFERHLPASALEVFEVARSASAKRFMSRLSGRDCEGPPQFSASWYRPGDFTHPHGDNQPHRSIAAVLNLTKDWDPKWGGSLFWSSNGAYITPRFNTLTLFNVSSTGIHQVIPVSPLAQQKRLTLNLWWTNQTPPLVRNKSFFSKSNADSAGITPHSYGRAPIPLAHRIVAV